MTLPGGNLKPAQGQRLVLSDPVTIEQDLPEQRLRFQHALTRRDQNRLSRASRAFFEHGREAFAVEDFFAT
jgi:hypothetical protein